MKAKNNGVITKATTDETYTIIPNSITQSKSLTFDAIGVLTYLLSLPSDWSIVKTNLHKQIHITEYRLDKAFKELIKNNYISTSRKQTQNGWVYTYNVYPVPTETPNNTLEILSKEMEEFKTILEEEITATEQPIKHVDQLPIIENIIELEAAEQATDINTPIYEEFENYINTNVWENDNYYIAEHRITSLTDNYDYSKLEVIRDNFEALRERKQLNWKDYKKIEDKLKWLHHYQQVIIKPEPIKERLPF